MVFLMMTVDESEYSFLVLSIVAILYLFYQIKGNILKEKMLVLFLLSRLVHFIYDFVCRFSGVYLREKVVCNYVSFAVYLVVSSFVMLSLMVYFYYLTKNWNRFRLLLDTSYYLFVVGYMLNITVFSSAALNNQQYIFQFIIFFIAINDALIALMLSFIVFNAERIKYTFLNFMFIGAYFSLLVVDVIFMVDYYYQLSGQLELFGDMLAGMSFVCMVYASDDLKDEKIRKVDNSPKSANAVGIRAVWYVFLIPILLVLFYKQAFIQMAIFLIITLSYFSINRIHRQMTIREQLLVRENRAKKEAAKSVTEKEEALLTANDVLYQASHKDHLTGLNNRLFFFDYASALINEPDAAFSILYIDLDHFKEVNDLHGHRVGDEVLIEVTKRFTACDLTDFVIARIGGDEFVVTYPYTDSERLLAAARCISESIAQPLNVDGLNFVIGSSIGIARYPQDASNVDELVNRADIAMYHAKRGNSAEKICIYSRSLFEVLEEKNRVELLMDSLRVERDLQLVFKPLYSARQATLYACDVSFCWDCAATLTCDMKQSEILALADMELLHKLMLWLIKGITKQSKEWQKRGLGEVKFIVDLPLRLLMEDAFMKHLIDFTSSNGFDANCLVFKISGRSASALASYNCDVLNALKQCGCAVVLDDFGRGYLSLKEVNDFSVKLIQINQPLVDSVGADDTVRRLVKSIILMAHSLNIAVIAKGVTTMKQLEALRALSCDYLEVDLANEWLTAEMFERQCLFAPSRGVL